MKPKLLEVKNLKTYFPLNNSIFSAKRKYVKAVDGISFTLEEGQTLGIVGESGCGKTTLGRSIMQVQKIHAGEVVLAGENLLELSKKVMRERRSDLSIIFQDPYESLNPRMTVGEIIAEPLLIQSDLSRKEIRAEVMRLMDLTGLDSNYIRRYPHQFSGGQRQRIGIARALSTKPKLMICDEPVSALDVSIQSQIINLLKEIQKDFGIAMVFISHDLAVVHHIAGKIAVMYLGQMMEMADADSLYYQAQHPYSQALLSAIPQIGKKKDKRQVLKGDIPSPIDPPRACVFHTRCPKAQPICAIKKPELKEIKKGHVCACHFA